MEFSANGSGQSVAVGIGLISDLDINVSGDILAALRLGVAVSDSTLATFTTRTQLDGSDAFIPLGSTFRRIAVSSSLPSRILDVTEFYAPLTVTISEGHSLSLSRLVRSMITSRRPVRTLSCPYTASGYVADSETIT